MVGVSLFQLWSLAFFRVSLSFFYLWILSFAFLFFESLWILMSRISRVFFSLSLSLSLWFDFYLFLVSGGFHWRFRAIVRLLWSSASQFRVLRRYFITLNSYPLFGCWENFRIFYQDIEILYIFLYCSGGLNWSKLNRDIWSLNTSSPRSTPRRLPPPPFPTSSNDATSKSSPPNPPPLPQPKLF